MKISSRCSLTFGRLPVRKPIILSGYGMRLYLWSHWSSLKLCLNGDQLHPDWYQLLLFHQPCIQTWLCIDSVIITSVLSVGIATTIFFSPITYKSEICAELRTEQPTPSNIGNTPSLLLRGLTFSKVTTAISRLIIVFLFFLYKWALFRATTSQLIMLLPINGAFAELNVMGGGVK